MVPYFFLSNKTPSIMKGDDYMSIIILMAFFILTIGYLFESVRFDNIIKANRKINKRKNKNRKRFNIDIK